MAEHYVRPPLVAHEPVSPNAARWRFRIVVGLAFPDFAEDPEKATRTGMHHSAFEYDSFADLNASYLRMKAEGVVPDFCLDHGKTFSYYPPEKKGQPALHLVNRRLFVLAEPAAMEAFLKAPRGGQGPLGEAVTRAKGTSHLVVAATGLPKRPGDDVTVLKRTGSGFLAAGANRPDGDRSIPVIFLSGDGRRWTRLGGGQLRLAGGGGQAQDIRLAAATGNRILIAGDIASGSGASGSGQGRAGAAWLSDDGGHHWRPVTVPGGHGATAEFSDMAATPSGFLLVRPATADGLPAADVYRSGNGTDWTFAANRGFSANAAR